MAKLPLTTRAREALEKSIEHREQNVAADKPEDARASAEEKEGAGND